MSPLCYILYGALIFSSIGSSFANVSKKLCDIRKWYLHLVADGVFSSEMSAGQLRLKEDIDSLVQRATVRQAQGTTDCRVLEMYDSMLQEQFSYSPPELQPLTDTDDTNPSVEPVKDIVEESSGTGEGVNEIPTYTFQEQTEHVPTSSETDENKYADGNPAITSESVAMETAEDDSEIDETEVNEEMLDEETDTPEAPHIAPDTEDKEDSLETPKELSTDGTAYDTNEVGDKVASNVNGATGKSVPKLTKDTDEKDTQVVSVDKEAKVKTEAQSTNEKESEATVTSTASEIKEIHETTCDRDKEPGVKTVAEQADEEIAVTENTGDQTVDENGPSQETKPVASTTVEDNAEKTDINVVQSELMESENKQDGTEGTQTTDDRGQSGDTITGATDNDSLVIHELCEEKPCRKQDVLDIGTSGIDHNPPTENENSNMSKNASAHKTNQSLICHTHARVCTSRCYLVTSLSQCLPGYNFPLDNSQNGTEHDTNENLDNKKLQESASSKPDMQSLESTTETAHRKETTVPETAEAVTIDSTNLETASGTGATNQLAPESATNELNRETIQESATNDFPKTTVTKDAAIEVDRETVPVSATHELNNAFESHREKLPSESISFEKIENILHQKTGEYTRKLQSLEIMIMKLENQVLMEKLNKHNHSSTITRLENQILKLENDLLRMSKQYNRMKEDTEDIRGKQQHYLEIAESQNKNANNYLALPDNTGEKFELVTEHQTKIKELMELVRNQSLAIKEMQSRSEQLEEQNRLLHQMAMNQSAFMGQLVESIQKLSEQSSQQTQETANLKQNLEELITKQRSEQPRNIDVSLKEGNQINNLDGFVADNAIVMTESNEGGQKEGHQEESTSQGCPQLELPNNPMEVTLDKAGLNSRQHKDRNKDNHVSISPGEDRPESSAVPDGSALNEGDDKLLVSDTNQKSFDETANTQYDKPPKLRGETKPEKRNGEPTQTVMPGEVNSISRSNTPTDESHHEELPEQRIEHSGEDNKQLDSTGRESKTNAFTEPIIPEADQLSDIVQKTADETTKAQDNVPSNVKEETIADMANEVPPQKVMPDKIQSTSQPETPTDASQSEGQPAKHIEQPDDDTVQDSNTNTATGPPTLSADDATLKRDDNLPAANSEETSDLKGSGNDKKIETGEKGVKERDNLKTGKLSDNENMPVGPEKPTMEQSDDNQKKQNAETQTNTKKDSKQPVKAKNETKKDTQGKAARKAEARLSPKYLDRVKSTDVKDCYDHYKRGKRRDGVYTLKLGGGELGSVSAFCDMKGGGWTVILKRTDGRTPFFKEWADYKKGFGGKYSGDHWLGNDNIHFLTNQDNYALRVELTDWEKNQRHALYDHFLVEDEENGYRLHVDGYSGDAGDGLTKHSGHKFSTKDVDNDKVVKEFGGSCANRFHGAGWYYKCYASNLMGKYYKSGKIPEKQFDGITWKPWTGPNYSMKVAVMKIRPVSVKD